MNKLFEIQNKYVMDWRIPVNLHIVAITVLTKRINKSIRICCDQVERCKEPAKKSGSLDSICEMDLHGQEVDSMIDNVIDPNTFYYQTQCDIPLRTCSQMTFRLVDEDDHLYTSHYPIYVSILFK